MVHVAYTNARDVIQQQQLRRFVRYRQKFDASGTGSAGQAILKQKKHVLDMVFLPSDSDLHQGGRLTRTKELNFFPYKYTLSDEHAITRNKVINQF